VLTILLGIDLDKSDAHVCAPFSGV
jgi:hypothetical protein